MKIYSWNMLFKNPDLDRAFEFVANSDFDIFCLQEVPDSFLNRLKGLSVESASRVDVERILPHEVNVNHNVILTRFPILNFGEVPFPEYWPYLKLRSRAFVWLMRPFGFSQIRNRGGLFVDVRVDDSIVRVFNLHLILGHPDLRTNEFEVAMAERDPSIPTIVCGDFNILESRLTIILNWIFGGHWSDAIYRLRERVHINRRFVAHELANALAGRITHRFSQSQLDHILVSHTLSIKQAQVITDSYGSDHNPIFADVA
jgi:endonuclease/exonuclease/phosphatase family metal-dependent hydrolase